MKDEKSRFSFTATSTSSTGSSIEDPVSIETFRFTSLFRYANKTDYLLFILGLIFAFSQGCCTALNTLIFKELTDVLISGQESWVNKTFDNDKFNENALHVIHTYFLYGFTVLVLAFCSMSCWNTFCERQIHKIRNAYFTSLLRQNWEYFDSHDSGAMTMRMSDSLERVRDGFGDKLGITISNVTHFLVGIIIAFCLSWKMSFVVLSCTSVFFIPLYFSKTMVSKVASKEMKSYESAGSTAEEVVSGIKTVQTFNGEQKEIDRYSKCLSKGMYWGIRRACLSTFFSAFMSFATFCSMALAFWYGTLMVIDGTITPGTTFAVFWAVSGSMVCLNHASPQFSVILTSHAAAAPIFKIIDRIIPIDGTSDSGIKVSNVKGVVKFENVSFKYPTRPEIKVLEKVNLYANPGENIALVGHSGCGKSTLAALLMNFYQVNDGKISIDGMNIEELNLSYLRNIVGIVSQEPSIFVDTVENNIKLGAPDLNEEEIKYYCQLSNAQEFISQLPQGLKTVIGNGGIELSGGQKQRIAIARTLARKPSILILDEATSALDSESESLVQTAVENSKKERTTITIAHRLSTIRNCNRIYVFDDGRIVEEGNHEELMKMNGFYTQMVQTQELEYRQSSPQEDSSNISKSTFTEMESSQRKNNKRLSKSSSSNSEELLSDTTRLKEKEEKQCTTQSNFVEILRYARPEWILLSISIFFSILRGFSYPIFSILYARMFKILATGTKDEKLHNAETNAFYFVILGISSAIVTMSSGFILSVVGEKLTKRLRITLFSNILRQDGEYFDHSDHSTGRLITRLATDAPNIRAAIDQRLADVLQGISAILCGTIIAFYYGPTMAPIGMATVGTLISIQAIITHILKKRGVKDARNAEKPLRLSIEAIEEYRTVQYLTREKHFVEKFDEGMKSIHIRNIQRGILQSFSYALTASYTYFNFAIGYRYGIYLITSNIASPFIIFQVIEAVNSASSSILAFGTYLPEYVRARVSAGLLFQMLREKPKIENCLNEEKKIELNGNISLNNIYFKYQISGRRLILNDFSLKIERGKTTALVGASGCGKSTIIQLLERFYDPIDGKISYDKKLLKDLNLKNLRSQIALVGQEPTLFNYSIRENISYGLEEIKEEEIIEAAKLANAHEFICKMPEGYETIVGEGGNKLSGGQKQRIAIARAIVRKPKILLLDEATSALDVESEKLVQEALEKAKEGRTCVVIAHRLSTIRGADSIAVIKYGRVIEQGTHQKLLSINGEYAKFVQKTLL